MTKVFLILYGIVSTAADWREQDRYEYRDMPSCIAALHSMQLAVPQGGDAESAIIAFCWEVKY